MRWHRSAAFDFRSPSPEVTLEMTDSSPTSNPEDLPSPITTEATISGKWVVLAILSFGVFLTGFMWIYTYLSNKPFIPLRHAIIKEYSRATSPIVQGGKERGRGASILRIVMNVEFDPTEKTDGVPLKVAGIERRVAELARENLDLKEYERWEFFLVYYPPEALPKRWESKRDISEIREDRF
jgi:hypothetical protein